MALDTERIDSLVTLLGDEDESIVRTARKHLMAMGEAVIPYLREQLERRAIHVRLRIHQIVNWLNTETNPRSLPSRTSHES